MGNIKFPVYLLSIVLIFLFAQISNAGSVNGKVVDFDSPGSGLSGATVALSGPGTYSTTTASEGVFTLASVTDGTYTITLTKSSYLTVSIPDVVVSGVTTLRLPMSEGPGHLRYGKIFLPRKTNMATIVPAGSSFDIEFKANATATFSSIFLSGYEKTIPITSFTPLYISTVGYWSIRAYIPSGTPYGLYDLTVNSSFGTDITTDSVRVVSSIKNNFYWIHITDMPQQKAGSQPTNASKVAKWLTDWDTFYKWMKEWNIINPEFVLSNGDQVDVYMDAGWGNLTAQAGQYSVFLSTLGSLNVPIGLTMGNHDSYGWQNEDATIIGYASDSPTWKDYFGLHLYAVEYGPGCFIGGGGIASGFEDADQLEWATQKFTKNKNIYGDGGMRVMFGHMVATDAPVFFKPFCETNGVKLFCGGHDGFPAFSENGVFYMNPGSGHGSTNYTLFRVTGSNWTQTGLSGLKLTLAYSGANDGTQGSLTATINNGYNEHFEHALIEFVMAPGVYQVNKGTMTQQFNNDANTKTYVHVNYDIPASAVNTVTVSPASGSVYTLTTVVSPALGGSISPSAGSYLEGTVVTLTATANPSCTFTSWTGDVTGTSNPIMVIMDSDKTVTATFTAAATYTLTTEIAPTGTGTISLNPTGIPAGTYTAGTSVQLTATAATGYTFTSWTGDASGATSPVSVTMNANKTVTATFTVVIVTTYTLTTAVSPTGGGTVTLNPTGVPIGTYTAGTTVTVTATAASDYTFTSWTGDAAGTSSPVTVTMNANKSVTATFTEIPIGSYALTTIVSPTGAGTVALSPAGGIYIAGTTVTVTATAATNYIFSGWSGDASGTTNPVTVSVNANKTVTAIFSVVTIATYTLTTTVSPTASGLVSLSPTGGTYTAGTTVTLTATSASGYSFTGWTGAATGTASPVTVTMDTDKSITATFTEIPIGSYALTTIISPTGAGTVALSPTGGVYTAGTSVELTATASTGYKFSSWTGSITGNSNQVAVTMDANKTVTATFTVVPLGSFTLTTFISPVGGGTVILDPTGGVYTAGTTVTAIAIANSGYKFTNWLGDATGTDNPITVTLNTDVAVIAYFSQTSSEETLEVKAYPNPFVASEATKITIKGSGITNSKIKLYTLSGKLVRLLEEKQGLNELNWDGKDDAGAVVVSGIYIYIATSGEKKVTGRIAVIR